MMYQEALEVTATASSTGWGVPIVLSTAIGMMMLAGVIILPIIGSLSICLPKWASQSNGVSRVGTVMDALPSAPDWFWGIFSTVLGFTFGALFYVLVAPLVWWWRRTEVFIWKRCPYSNVEDAEYAVQDRVEGTRSYWPRFGEV